MATQSKIPKIADNMLIELSKRIIPMHAAHCPPNSGTLYAYDFEKSLVNLRDSGFFWIKDVRKEAISPSNLPAEIERIPTYHDGGFSFAPSMADVISQIPLNLRDKVGSFQVITPERGICSAQYPDLYDNEYHIAETILYGKA